METKSIIKKVKNVWYHVKAWMAALFMMLLMFSGVTAPWLFFGKWANIIAEIWHEGNLLYIPDLIRLLGYVAGIIMFSIVAVVGALAIIYAIGYIIYKFYAYIFKKDEYALRNILDELVYKF